MNEFKSLEAADGLIAHLTNEPLEPGRARALTADGTLKVCFAHKGNIGLFPRLKAPAAALFPQPVETFYFVGDLQSVTRPQLDGVVYRTAQVPGTKIYEATISTVDSLHPFEVAPIRKLGADPDIDMSRLSREGFFWGRVQSAIKHNGRVFHPAMLDRGPVPVDQWRIQSDELYAVFQKQANQSIAGTQKVEVSTPLSHEMETAKAASNKPLQRTAAQDAEILCEIKKQGYDPLALPGNPRGKQGVKAVIRAALLDNPLFVGSTVFNKAWERLTARSDIVIQG